MNDINCGCSSCLEFLGDYEVKCIEIKSGNEVSVGAIMILLIDDEVYWMRLSMKEGKKEGIGLIVREDGTLFMRMMFVNDECEGEVTKRNENGSVVLKGRVSKGKEVGIWIEYDDDGNEKIDSGHMSTMVNSFGEDYGSIMTHSQPDRCIAEPNIHLGEKDTIDCETLKDQLCQDCLDKVCEFYEDQVNSDNDEYLESTGYSLIDFTTRELYTLSDPYRGYSIRDYMIRYDYREQGDGEKYIDLLIFYAPIRGEEG